MATTEGRVTKSEWRWDCRRGTPKYLPTQSRIWLFSWHIYYLLCQELDEEMMFSFFWWRLPVEASRYEKLLVVIDECNRDSQFTHWCTKYRNSDSFDGFKQFLKTILFRRY